MKLPIDQHILASVLEQMGIDNISNATIRQSGAIGKELERLTQTEFLHLEMGIPGLPPSQIGIEAECEALKAGVASIYPNMSGIPEFKENASRFIKAFLDVDIDPLGCIPTVGSMQGSFTSFVMCSQMDPDKDTVLFIDPGFPVQRNQARLLGIKAISFDIYHYRGEALREKLEEFLSAGNISAVIYSSPNNPAWFCMSDEELRIIGELANKYDVIVIEDLAYLCMDFRKDLGIPFEAPFQPSVAHHTDNYIIMMSGSKMFSYAGQRIAFLAISDKLYHRDYPALRERYRMSCFGDVVVLGVLYALSSGTSHSAQYAMAAMLEAAVKGRYNFVKDTSEYGRRASLVKKMFTDNGFRIVYAKDGEEDVSDGFFFTAGYKDMSSAELLKELMLYGICTISLSLTGSRQDGVRVCVSQLNREEQFDMLAERLQAFNSTH